MSIATQVNHYGHSLSGDLPHIALTKTVPPSVSKFAVARQGLLDTLAEATTRRLILFKAPAGYGKTTLAADWCQRLRQTDAVVAWLSIDSEDNEPSAFAYHVAKALQRADPDLGRDAIELLEVSSLIPPRNVVSALVNAVSESDSEIYLILDDFHLVTDTRCHDLMSFLLRYAPSNFHLVILSRSEPRFALTKLQLAEEIAEIDASMLRFNRDETTQFLGSDLSTSLLPTGIEKLHSATEGWPAALQLARISLQNSANPTVLLNSFSGTSRTISAYLDETLASEPDEIVEFLINTSILEQMNRSLAEAVTGLSRSGELLDALERRQLLLVPLAAEGGWYRHHYLMSQFLEDRLRARLPDHVSELHRRAYRWYASQEMWTEAVRHAIEAKDFDEVLEFIENCAMTLVVRGDLLTLLSWERQLPEKLMSGQLQVKLALAWGMALVNRFTEADTFLSNVEEAASAERGSDLWWKCRAVRAVIFGLEGESAKARNIALDCLQNSSFDSFYFDALCHVIRYGHLKSGDWDAFYAVPKPKPAERESSQLSKTYQLCLYGLASAHQLECTDALGFYNDARELAMRHTGPKSVSAAMVTGLKAATLFERGNICEAEVSVLDDFDLIETTAFHESFLQAFLVLIRAAKARGDAHRAIDFVNRAERIGWERGWRHVIAASLLERVRILLAMGQTDDAQSLLPAYEQLKARQPSSDRCTWAEIYTCSKIAEGLVAGAAGRYGDAIRLLTSAYEELLATNDLLSALRVGTEISLVHQRSESPLKAIDTFKPVLTMAANAGAVGFVFDCGPDISQLISLVKNSGGSEYADEVTEFTDVLLALINQRKVPEQTSPTPEKPKQMLTDRENSIVEFIAKGKSNKEIARALGVAPETIKTHVKRIFSKLSAASRAQAVVRAQSLGLLRGI
jgi:LuxR family maltose regulon positive regulatory protein